MTLGRTTRLALRIATAIVLVFIYVPLTLVDYIVPGLVSTSQFIGNVIVINVAQDLPLAAAYSLVPLAIILIYLLVARRLGAFSAF